MAQIPSGTKFIGIDASIPTPELSGARVNSKTQHFTIEDIVGEVPSDTSKSYVVSLSQTGTSNPVSTVYKNTAGFTSTFTRLSEGIYTLDLPVGYTANKIACNINLGLNGNYAYINFNGSSIQITCLNGPFGEGTPIDDVLFEAVVTIELFD